MFNISRDVPDESQLERYVFLLFFLDTMTDFVSGSRLVYSAQF
jgi:hypothetical protein